MVQRRAWGPTSTLDIVLFEFGVFLSSGYQHVILADEVSLYHFELLIISDRRESVEHDFDIGLVFLRSRVPVFLRPFEERRHIWAC